MIFSTNIENSTPDFTLAQQEILRAAAEGDGFAAILRLAYRALRARVVLCSTSLYLIACCPEDKESFFFHRSGDMILPQREAMADFFNSGIPQHMIDSPDEPFLARYLNTEIIHLFCGVRVRKALAAYLCITWNQDDLPDSIRDFVVFLSRILSLEMQKSHLTGASFFDRELLLAELLNGQYIQLQLTLEQFPNLLETSPNVYRLCAVCAAESETSTGSLLLFREQFLRLYPDAVCHLRDSVLYILFRRLRPAKGEQLLVRLQALLRAYHFRMSCSNPVYALSRLPEYLKQVDSLCKMSRGSAVQGKEICLFENVLPMCAFDEAYQNVLPEEWVHPHIRCFMEYDAQYQTDYITSLAAYLHCGRNMQAAANALFIHKTSLAYRFKKMQDISAPFLHDAELLFLYEYSLRILHL